MGEGQDSNVFAVPVLRMRRTIAQIIDEERHRGVAELLVEIDRIEREARERMILREMEANG